jgi:hypothetical protein
MMTSDRKKTLGWVIGIAVAVAGVLVGAADFIVNHHDTERSAFRAAKQRCLQSVTTLISELDAEEADAHKRAASQRLKRTRIRGSRPTSSRCERLDITAHPGTFGGHDRADLVATTEQLSRPPPGNSSCPLTLRRQVFETDPQPPELKDAAPRVVSRVTSI